MPGAAAETDRPPAAVSWATRYRAARDAGMQEWHAREFADERGDLALLERLIELGCPRHLIARIAL